MTVKFHLTLPRRPAGAGSKQGRLLVVLKNPRIGMSDETDEIANDYRQLFGSLFEHHTISWQYFLPSKSSSKFDHHYDQNLTVLDFLDTDT